MKWLFVFLLVFSLAACDDNGGDNTAVPTIETLEETPVGGDTGDVTEPDETMTDTVGADVDTAVEITGDVDQMINQGQLVYTSAGADEPYYELTFTEGLDAIVMITFPGDTAPGTYELTSSAEPGALGAEVSLSREAGNAAAGALDFSEDVQGTLTIDEIGTEPDSSVSGTFEFTTTAATGEGGEDTPQTVTVTGLFDLPLQVADDVEASN